MQGKIVIVFKDGETIEAEYLPIVKKHKVEAWVEEQGVKTFNTEDIDVVMFK